MRDDNTALAVALCLLCFFTFAAPAAAQDGPHVVVGWETTRPVFPTGHLIAERENGWNAELILPAHKGLDIVGEVEGLLGKRIPLGFVVQPSGTDRPTITAAGTGVRYTLLRKRRINPFGEGRVGVAAVKTADSAVDFLTMTTSTNFEESASAGADIRLWRSFGVEATASYRAAHVFSQWMHRAEYGVGASWWFK